MYATYSRLAAATPGSEPIDSDLVAGYGGPFPHAIGNFITVSHVDHAVVAEANRLARLHPSLLVYAPFASNTTEVEMLERAGFTNVTSYVVMVSLGLEFTTTVDVVQAKTIGERHTTVEFMSEQFFSKSSRAVRDQMIASTALSRETDLFFVRSGRDLVAACMLSRSDSCLGLYNLCVRSSHRLRGLGATLLRFAADMAKREGRVFTLQCLDEIVPFYTRFGLESIGSIQVMSNFRADSL